MPRLPPAPDDRVTPQVRLVRPLGAGGMGHVWVARHEALGIDVAVKLLAPEAAPSERMRRRFEREAALLAKVRSPHVVAVLDAGAHDSLGPFLVMELLDGHDLAKELEARGRLPLAEVVDLVTQAATGLAKAHERGLVHRDVKLENLVLAKDGARTVLKVVDFGVALDEDEGERLTGLGVAIGTRSTMSPEQAAGGPIDARSDLYSLALVFFRLLTGEPAISRASLDALGLAAYRAERPRPSALVPGVPAEVDAWFSKATSFAPDARFPDAQAFVRALEVASRGEAAAAPSGGPSPGTVDDAPALGTVDDADALDNDAPPAPRQGVAPGSSRPRARASGAPAPLRPGSASPAPSRGPALVVVAGILAAGALVAYGLRAMVSRSGHAPLPSASLVASGDAAAPAPPLRLALLMDVSGDNRRRGQELERATRTALTMIGEAGGVRGRAVALSVVDDQGALGPFLAARADEAAKLGTVPVVLGPLLSPQVHEVRELLDSRAILEVSGTATATALTAGARSGSFLALAPDDDAQAAALASALRGTSPRAAPCARVAIVASTDAHGAPFATALAASLARAPAVPTKTHAVDAAAKRDYADLARAVEGDRADCVALLVPPKVGARVLGSFSAPLRDKLRTFGGDTLASEDFVEFSLRESGEGKLVAEGLTGVKVAVAPPSRPELVTFARKFQAITGSEPKDPFAARQFDATIVVALGLAAAGVDAKAPEIRKAAIAATRGKAGYGPDDLERLFRAAARGEDVRYEGASGDVSLGDDGRVIPAFELYGIRGGALVPLTPK
ncbi:MAG: protein kinase [Myxococcales bacterium]|nr:protein kinase [Myxococcales bacterium]